jgi:hypothetical protein
MPTNPTIVDKARPGILAWLESVRCTTAGWGRWRYSTAMTRPWALQASGMAVTLLQRLGELAHVPAAAKRECADFFNSFQDPADHLFKDPFETEALRAWTTHTWAQIWGQRHGAVLEALAALGASPGLPPAEAQFVDVSRTDGGAWAAAQDWRNPWLTGEDWTRAIQAFVRTPAGNGPGARERLDPLFAFVETRLLDPATGFPTRLGCERASVAMAGLFKLMWGYHAAGRPVPFAERAIDATLALQLDSGEFAEPRDMCMNWDAAFILFHLNRQLDGRHRSAEIAAAIARLADVLLAVYRKPDGGFAFHGETCLTVHHSIRLCEKPEPVSDMLGTVMCQQCLEYADAVAARAAREVPA